MIKERQLAIALRIAAQAHCGQVDKKGEPYILHPIRVMLAGSTMDERIVGILHDVVEDTHITLEDLEEEGFDDVVINGVHALTRDPQHETYSEFIDRIIRAGRLAITVKLNDMRDNLDPKRMFYLPKEEQMRLKNKYGHEKTKLISALEALHDVK